MCILSCTILTSVAWSQELFIASGGEVTIKPEAYVYAGGNVGVDASGSLTAESDATNSSSLLAAAGTVTGNVTYEFDVLKPTDSIRIDAQHMEFYKVTIDGKPAQYSYDRNRIQIAGDFELNQHYSIGITYSTVPKKAMYFVGWGTDTNIGGVNQVWTQGQGKYTSNWLPSFDDVNEKVIFDGRNLYDKEEVEGFGFEYYSIGR